MITLDILTEIIDLYDLGYENGWHNKCFSNAIRKRIAKFGDSKEVFTRAMNKLLKDRRAAVSMSKEEFKTMHPEKDFC